MSSMSKRRRNCRNYRESYESGNRGGGSGRQKNHWKDAQNLGRGKKKKS